MYKRLSFLLVIVLMAGLVLSGCGTKEPAEEQTEQTEAVSSKYGGILKNAYFAML